MRKRYKIGATIVSYILSLFFILMGFYKMCVYDNLKYGDGSNAYVEGDVYNHIVNASYAILFFALGVMCAISGIAFIISYYMDID